MNTLLGIIIFVLSQYRTDLLAVNHLIIRERTDLKLNRNIRNFCLKL